MKKFLVIGLLLIASTVFAGQKEDMTVAYWQEHIRALQMDFELSNQALKQAQSEQQKAQAEEKKTAETKQGEKK